MNDFFSFLWSAITGEAERRLRQDEQRRIRAKEDLMTRLEVSADGTIEIERRSPSRVVAALLVFFALALAYAGFEQSGQTLLFLALAALLLAAAYAAATQGSRAAVELDSRLLHVWKSSHSPWTAEVLTEVHTTENLDDFTLELRFERKDQGKVLCRLKLGRFTISTASDPEVARVEAIAWSEFLDLPKRVQKGFPV